jgi:menaquinone-dependent protoporphyrinogen oxidase
LYGGARYMGRWHRDARAFLERHRDDLSGLPLAVFGIGPKTVAPEDVAASRAQLDRSLAKTPELSPACVAIFGGVVDPADLRFPFNRMPASDARDWDAVRAWAIEVGNVFAAQPLPLAG